MKSIDITIQDKEGLHARPAGILSKAAKGFESKVTMTKNGKVADMKKIFAVMGLAVKCGETVTIAADGSQTVDVQSRFAGYSVAVFDAADGLWKALNE